MVVSSDPGPELATNEEWRAIMIRARKDRGLTQGGMMLEWRVLGEKLRERSPAEFRKVLALLKALLVGRDDKEPPDIDSIYPYH